jgi:pSer/pThr/pTyr-binding forkhead associated (FHA) protein
MVTILIKEEDKPEREFQVEKFPVSIGRSKENTIQIQNPFFSREHCLIEQTSKGFRIKDLGSKNGIQVNKQSVKASDLNPGDTISIGKTDFKLIGAEKKEAFSAKKHASNLGGSQGAPVKKVPESVWNRQLEKELVVQCSHCRSYFSRSYVVPGVGIYCPKCKTQFT